MTDVRYRKIRFIGVSTVFPHSSSTHSIVVSVSSATYDPILWGLYLLFGVDQSSGNKRERKGAEGGRVSMLVGFTLLCRSRVGRFRALDMFPAVDVPLVVGAHTGLRCPGWYVKERLNLTFSEIDWDKGSPGQTETPEDGGTSPGTQVRPSVPRSSGVPLVDPPKEGRRHIPSSLYLLFLSRGVFSLVVCRGIGEIYEDLGCRVSWEISKMDVKWQWKTVRKKWLSCQVLRFQIQNSFVLNLHT